MAEKNAWTDELKAEVIEEYQSREPTPENSTEIVGELAEEYNQKPNGVRMILVKAGVYIKKDPEKSSSKTSTGGSKRVNKAEAIDGLKSAIEDAGQEVDEDIVSRLTGKAAVYFTGVITAVNG